MDFLKKISWEQGLFLQPQHFQVSDIQKDVLLYKYMGLIRDNLWGCDNLVLDTIALQENKLIISSGKFIFKDGSMVEIGGNAFPVSRSFEKIWSDKSKSLEAYIGLKKLDMKGSNVTTITSEYDVKYVKTRFVALEQLEMVKDFYHTGPDAYIKTQMYSLNIIWSDEIENSAEYEILPFVKICQYGEKISFDIKYIPPCLKIDSDTRLYDTVRSIRDNLASRAKQLEIYKFQSAVEDISIQNRRWLNLLALQVFNRYISSLTDLLNIKIKSPSDSFAILIQLINELKTFTSNNIVLNINLDSINFLDYNHNDLAGIFNTARDLILKLCDNITFTPSQFYQLQYVNGIFSADLPLSIFTPRTVYYIRASNDKSIQTLRAIDFESQIKIGSVTTISKIVERSLEGVPFEVLSSAPAGVPSDSGSIYIRLDSGSEHWRNIVSSLSIALFWNDVLEEIKFDFVCVRS